MLSIISNFLVTLLTLLGLTYISSNILNCDLNYKSFKNYTLILIFSIILVVTTTYFTSYSKFILNIFISFFLIYILYKQDKLKTLIAVLLSIFFNIISEVLCILILNIILKDIMQIQDYLSLGILLNIIVIILACILSVITKRTTNRLIEMLDNNKELYFFILIFILIIILIIPMFYLFKNDNKIENILIIVIFIILCILLFIEKIKKQKVNSRLNMLYNQSTQISDLIDKYRKVNHENINQLIIIRNMIKNKKYKSSIDFIDEILCKKNVMNFAKELEGFKNKTLSGFLNFKYNDMITKNILVNFEISEEAKEINIENFISKDKIKDFYNILGIILDNALEASVDSKDKLLTVNMYIDEEYYVINIANSFNQDIDLNSIGKKGYTTKGSGRGYGLILLDEIINRSTIFEVKRKIIKNIFYCEIRTKLNLSK